MFVSINVSTCLVVMEEKEVQKILPKSELTPISPNNHDDERAGQTVHGDDVKKYYYFRTSTLQILFSKPAVSLWIVVPFFSRGTKGGDDTR